MELALSEKSSTNSFWRLKMHKTLSLILILFLNFGVLSATTDNITSESVMNVFNSGETISSSKMNENFEILKLSKTELVNIVNELRDNLTQISNQMIQLNSQLNSSNNNLFFPDGLDGEMKTLNMIDNSYSVPNGKTFYITYHYGSVDIDGKMYASSTEGGQFSFPVVVKGGSVLTGDNFITGFEIDANVEIVNEDLDYYSNPYTVPNGKTLFILSVTSDKGDGRDGLFIQSAGNVECNSTSVKLHQNRVGYTYKGFPIIVTEGHTLCPSSVGWERRITGYLKNN